VDRADEGD